MNIFLAELVWKRAQGCCEYCRMPQIYDELPFEIDHIVAEQLDDIFALDKVVVAKAVQLCVVGVVVNISTVPPFSPKHRKTAMARQ